MFKKRDSNFEIFSTKYNANIIRYLILYDLWIEIEVI